MRAAKQVQAVIQELHIPHNNSKVSSTVTLSIGSTTIIPEALVKPQELIAKADSALYLSKSNGRNTISTVNL